MDVKFRPLYDSHDDGPLCFLLQIKDFTILLDCGWGDPYDVTALQPLLDVLDSVDAVLLSHPDSAHLGALPFLMGKMKMEASVYASGATHKMGQMFLYNEYLTHHAAGDFTAFDLDDVDSAFGRINQLRFRQEVALGGTGVGIAITPLPAGRLIGGTVWRISAGGEEFVYAVDFNHRRERHLSGTPLESAFHRPSFLITDVAAAGRPPVERERSERALLDACLSTLRSEGNVLIPVDAAGRVLELLLVFEQHWAEHRLPYLIVLLGPMMHTMLEFARSQLEWMNETLVKSFGHSKDNPFALRHVKICSAVGELRKLPSGPKIVLAVEPSLEVGPARQLFADWAGDARNLVVVALKPKPGSLADAALTSANQRLVENNSNNNSQLQQQQQAPPPLLHITLSKRVPLKGEELEKHLEEQQQRREEEAAAAEAAGFDTTMLLLENEFDIGNGGGGAAGGSPRSATSTKSASTIHPTRANVASIGHAGRDAAGLGGGGGGGGAYDMGGDAFNGGEGLVEAAESAVACLVEGFEVVEGAVAPMFPGEDEWEAEEYDDYGAMVNFAEFEEGEKRVVGRLGQALASEAEAERGGMTTMGDGDGGGGTAAATALAAAEDAPEAQIPTKIETQDVSVALAARMLRIDFDGRSDGRSVQTIVVHVAPSIVILVHGSSSSSGTGNSTTAYATKIRTELEGLYTEVLTPVAGEEVAVTVGPSFDMELSEKLMRGAAMHAVGGYELAWVNGVVGPPEDGHQQMQGGEETAGPSSMIHAGGPTTTTTTTTTSDVDGTIITTTNALPTFLPQDSTSTGIDGGGAAYGGVFIGDVRLSELKKALTAAGIRAEFHGGALYCTGQVVVRRRGEGGGLLLEGAMSDAYYKVRDVVYGQYHIC